MKLIYGDCLIEMDNVTDKSVDMVFADLPYGTTYAKWDSIIPMDKLWIHYERIVKDNGAIIFTANANRQPLKQHESVLVFSKKSTLYYPQKTKGKKNHIQGNSTVNASDTRLINIRVDDDLSGLKFPKSILNFPKHSSQCGNHPTEKPVSLIEYLIKTYSLEGEVVMDNTMGSGSTGVACVHTGRHFIGIESNDKYFDIAKNRINNAIKNVN